MTLLCYVRTVCYMCYVPVQHVLWFNRTSLPKIHLNAASYVYFSVFILMWHKLMWTAMLSDIQYIGIVGVTLYGILFFVSIRRLHYFCYPFSRPYFTTRKIFHALMVIYSVLQGISYVNFICIENYSSWNYACHVLAIFCEISSFSLVAILWSKSLLRYII